MSMVATRLHSARSVDGLSVDLIEIPRPGRGEALVRVHAASITRDELDWPVDRLPAIPSYELSGVVAAVGPDVAGIAIGDPVYGLMPFDRDGAAAEYAVAASAHLAPKPRSLGHVQSAALALAGLTAWQGLFVHGQLREGHRVLIHGARGGVGHLATQLAHWRGATVIGSVSGSASGGMRPQGVDQLVDRVPRSEDMIDPVDLVFDTVGGEALTGSAAFVRDGGRIVSVAEEPPAVLAARRWATYFVVEPNREQLVELARLAEAGTLRPMVDSVYPLAESVDAFARVMMTGKRGKVVLRMVAD